MDKEHMELKLVRSLSIPEFVELAEPIWGAEGRQLAAKWRPRAMFLVGAGASRSAPVAKPVMSEFMNSFMDSEGNVFAPTVPSHLIPRWEAVASEATAIVKSATALLGRRPDIEELLCLSHLTRGREFDPLLFQTQVDGNEALRTVSTWNSQACWEFHKLVTYHLFDVYSGVSDQAAGQLYEPVLAAFLDTMPADGDGKRIVPVITTNYDRCIEGAVAHWNRGHSNPISLVDGFLAERPQGQYGERPGGEEWVWGPAVHFRGDMTVTDRKGEIVFPWRRSRFLADHFWERSPDTFFVPYFKIHGSLNWVYNHSILVRVDMEDWLWTKEKLPLYHKLRDIDWPQAPLLIPYLWEPGNKQWFTNAYQQVAYRFFEEALKHVKWFVFAGYSFRDRHLMDALRGGLQANPRAAIIAIDPAPSLRPDLMNAFGDRTVTHIRASLAGAAEELRRALSAD